MGFFLWRRRARTPYTPRAKVRYTRGSPAAGEPMSEEKQSLWSQIRAFDGVFWICIFMELMERMAYYGVRLVVPVFLVLAPSDGGPGLSHTEKGTILACWAAMQSWLPTFSGGFSDRFGYKRTIAVSVILKTLGYAGMAMAGGFWTMLAGTQLLAAGTGLFKPGIQGTMAHSIAKTNGAESMGWGLFYQSVNVGAAVSAYIPMFTRDIFGWSSVFWACSAIVLSNLIPLMFYQDPTDERQTERDERGVMQLVRESVGVVFTSPVLLGFILISAGFWFTFHQMFDMLPNYVDDWTDSSLLLVSLGSLFHIDSWLSAGQAGELIPQERLLNINALMIMFTMFIFAWLSSRMRVLTSTIVGMAVATGAVALLISSANVYVIVLAVVIFTVGEMLSSPKRQEFMANLAPPGKRALFLGYANMPDGIGWVLGSLIAGSQYEEKGDKVNLTRRMLSEQPAPGAVEQFVREAGAYEEKALAETADHIREALALADTTTPQQALEAFASHADRAALLPEVLPRGHVIDFAVRALPQLPDGGANSPGALRDYLYTTYHPGKVWIPFVVLSATSAVLMVVFDRWVQARKARGQTL